MHLIRRRLRDERGYAMVAVMAVMLVSSLAAVAAVRTTDADIRQGVADRDKKGAYAAAEAGVNDYLARLIADVDYWRHCANPPTPNPSLGLKWDGTSARPWAPVPGSASAQYTVELLPANGTAQCETSNPQGTFIDAATGTFKIRATGKVKETGEKRSIIATFRRRGFLDYVYFTDFETFAPELMLTHNNVGGRPTRVSETDLSTVQDWARTACAQYHRQGRGNERFSGQFQYNGTWYTYGSTSGIAEPDCPAIQFIGDDEQLGPFHTNDEIYVCGTPRFGRQPSDDIEVSAPSPANGGGGTFGSSTGWRACPSGGSPSVNDPTATSPDGTLGTWRKGSPIVTLPPSNTALRDEALPAYRFRGNTTIRLNGDTMTVTGRRAANGAVLDQAVMPIPTDGVIYVGNDPGLPCSGHDVVAPNVPADRSAQLSTTNGCGDVKIRGTYAKSITITAQNDILIDEDVRRSGDTMLGLIADEWIRIHHPTTGSGYNCGSNNGGPGSMQIDAAMLAINKSFTVDYYWCGDRIGTLSVDGAIAQRFRGPVGRGGSGYIKDYEYDDRLRFRSPPRFLDPVQASWKLQSQIEQVPAT